VREAAALHLHPQVHRGAVAVAHLKVNQKRKEATVQAVTAV
jgi:hypothetical protein